MRKAVITITPDDPHNQIDCQTGKVSKIEIIESLQALIKGLAQQMVEEARQQVGDDPKAQEKWLDLQRQKPEQN